MTPSSTSVALVPHPSPFDIPELLELIIQYLTNHDIVQCMATSKALARQWEPFLWRNVNLKWSLPAPTLARNRHWIQSLSISVSYNHPGGVLDVVSHEMMHDSIDRPNIIGFHRLHSIHISIDRPEDYHQSQPLVHHTLQILQQCPNLTNLTLPCCVLVEQVIYEPLRMFLDTLKHKLPHLQQLAIDDGYVHEITVLRFLSVCFNHPQLIDLRCGFSFTFRKLESRALLELVEDIKEKAIPDKQPTISRLKTLILPHPCYGYEPDVLHALLKDHLPNLERFQFEQIANHDDDDLTFLFRDAVLQGCPKLQHIEFRCDHNQRHGERAVQGVILGCKKLGLKSFRGAGYEEGDSGSGHSVMKTLLDHHSNTLEDVELEHCEDIVSQDLARLFYGCKNLRRVKIEPASNGLGRFLYYNDMVSEEWICHNLRELQITLPQRHDVESGGETWMYELVKKAFGQIGRLSKLEILCLGSHNDSPLENLDKDLTLEHGGLSELAGLKRLRHFGMVGDQWLGMGQAEVEFMDSQWPQLEKVSFRGLTVSRVQAEPHWQWLQARRPWLRFRLCLHPDWIKCSH